MNIELAESKVMFRTLFETMGEGFAIHEVVFDHNGKPYDCRYLEINPAFEKLTGLTRDKVIGKTMREALPQVEEYWIETFCRVATSGEPAELENHVREQDRYYRVRAYSSGRNKFVVVYEDVTVQKKAMLELERREEQLRILFETSHAGIILVDPSGVIVLANQRMAEMFGSSMEELIGSRYPDHVSPDQRSSGDDRMRKLIAGEIDHVSTERHYIRKDGSDFWGHLSGRRQEDSEGKFINLVGQIADITEMKLAEEALRRSEERISLAAQATNIGIWDWDVANNVLSWDDSMYCLYGIHKEDFSGAYEAWSGTLHPDDRQYAENEVQAALRAEREYAPEFRIIRPDGTVRFIKAASRTIFDENGKPLRMIGTNIDTTERKELEDELQNSLELFSLFMKYSPVYTFIKQIEGDQSRVLQISDNFVDMVGRPAEELRGRTMDEIFPEEFARKITADDLTVVNEAKVIEVEEQLNDRSYITIKFPIIRDGKDNLLAGFTIDITDRKRAENERERMERQLLHAQKLESLGVLAGGIAHDFNNILMAIIGNADLALMRIHKESPVVDNLHRIEQAAARAADLARQMLAYSGKGKFVVENIDLNTLLEEMLHMLEVSISKKAVLRFSPHHPLPPVEADATQIRQVIMNLVINASEAIGDRSGVIAITTGCMECDRSYLKDVWLNENLADGLYVYLEIADSGCGMDRETLSKLFDPFFTTKFTGRGLGMAAVLGIARGHKGAIKVYSEPGKGTTFKILLPASGCPADLFNCDSCSNDWQGSGTVLLVDDEETIRGIGVEMLKELGFQVITAADGLEAVDAYKSTPGIAFVILDLTMPHMDGEQCFRELRRFDPDVKVIMSSGYNEQEVTRRFIGKGLAGFLQKPYKLSTLQEVIRTIAG